MTETFFHTAEEIIECMGDVIDEGTWGAERLLKNHPSKAVREIRLESMDSCLREAVEAELAILPLLSHPHIQTCDQVLLSGEFAYAIVKHSPKTLATLITKYRAENRLIPVETMFFAANQIAAGLAYLHAEKADRNKTPVPAILHRSLRPASILVSEEETQFAVAGFGRHLEAPLGATLNPYEAPEIASGGEHNKNSDVWSVGAVILELITLKQPGIYGHEPILEGLPQRAQNLARLVCYRVLRQNPKERATADELADAVQALMDAENVSRVIGYYKNVLARDKAHMIRYLEFLDNQKYLQASLADVQAISMRHARQIVALERKCNAQTAQIQSLEAESAALKATIERLGFFAGLMAATRNNDLDAIRIFVDKRLGIRKHDNNGTTALMVAAEQGNTEAVELLVAKEKRLLDNNGRTALMYASISGHLPVVELLLQHEKGIKDKDGHTALTLALDNNHLDIVRLLLKHEKDAARWSPLICAVATGNLEAAKNYLGIRTKRDSSGNTAIIIAAKVGNENMVELLDPTDNCGITALMRAAASGETQLVKALIPIQAKRKTSALRYHEVGTKSCKFNSGSTALMFAARFGQEEATRMLAGSELGMTDNWNTTALMHASVDGRSCVVPFLLQEAGMQSSDGYTALMIASERDHSGVAALLHHKEARMQNEELWTALMISAVHGYTSITNLLIEHEMRMQDKNGTTALMKAAATGHPEIVISLRDKEVGFQDKWGWSALMWAACAGDADITKLLADHEKGLRATKKREEYPPDITALGVARMKIYSKVDYQAVIDILSQYPEEEYSSTSISTG
ncbi:Kinase, NEK [Giardia lamblia P15]|uniref:Kinase, NEK n=1 Tax=Giardia intestinalis (strain P15) TaxID=658858 RepID=E1EWB6_GIAIA|nr:Kinase, NEK [Giardia lamblia P15]